MQSHDRIDRRRFLKGTAAGIGTAAVGAAMLGSQAKAEDKPETQPAVDESKLIWRNKQPGMNYARLGRTNFMCGRIVAGWIRNTPLLRRILASGVNYFDTARGYGEYEVEAADFFKKYRDKLWITSKSTDIAGHGRVDPEVVKLYQQAMAKFLGPVNGDDNLLMLHERAVAKFEKTGEKPDLRPVGKLIADMYLQKLEESLSRMGVDDIDCYMMHGIEIPWIFDCHELWDAYEKAHKAGKVKHFGYSVHKNHKVVLAAGVEANRKGPWKIDLIMAGINPETFDDLKPELEAIRKQDVGMIAMKTSGIKNRPVDGREEKLKSLMGGKEYNEWERAKLWMLHISEGLIDACIAGVSNAEELDKVLALQAMKLSAAAKRELKAIVKLEMSGSCSLCGACETNCPEHVAVADMIRYHAYIHQYDEKEMARGLYKLTGHDPARMCSRCGTCASVCPSGVAINDLLDELSRDMA